MTEEQLADLKNFKVRVTLTNQVKNISLVVELGIVEKFYGGGLQWTIGLPFEAVLKKLISRKFKIKKIKVLDNI